MVRDLPSVHVTSALVTFHDYAPFPLLYLFFTWEDHRVQFNKLWLLLQPENSTDFPVLAWHSWVWWAVRAELQNLTIYHYQILRVAIVDIFQQHHTTTWNTYWRITYTIYWILSKQNASVYTGKWPRHNYYLPHFIWNILLHNNWWEEVKGAL